MWVDNGNESDTIEKIEKQSNPKVMNLLRRFGFNELSLGLWDGETKVDKITMDLL